MIGPPLAASQFYFYITTTVPSNALYCNETCHSNATPPPTALPRTCNALHLLLKVDSLKEPDKHMGTVAECAVPTRFHITSGTFTATRYFLGSARLYYGASELCLISRGFMFIIEPVFLYSFIVTPSLSNSLKVKPLHNSAPKRTTYLNVR